MSGADTNLASAALAISLVALLTTIGQLLQQYLATADGYRRCQESVMGAYARKTRLKWKWREFRFETLYTTPEIFMVGDGAPNRNRQVILTGSKESRERSMVPAASTTMRTESDNVEWTRGDGPVQHEFVLQDNIFPHSAIYYPYKETENRGELACWVPFLYCLHETSQACLSNEVPIREDPIDLPHSRVGLPAIMFRERSWDFQYPDVVRPLAKTTLSDIAIIARRMGMRWKDFRPSDGILRAEGHSQVITSTVVRSLGIVLQYSYTGQTQRLRRAGVSPGNAFATGPAAEATSRKRIVTGSLLSEQEEIYIPRSRSDRLGCGVLRSDPLLGLPDITVSTQSEIVTSLSFLDRTGASSTSLTSILKENPEFHFRVADLVALMVQPVRYRGSRLVQVPAPSDNVHGVTTSSIGRRAFRQCLEEYIVVHQGDVGLHTSQALQTCNSIGTTYAAWDHTDDYSTQDEQWIVTRDPGYLDVLLEKIESLTQLIHSWEQEHSFRYINLLGIHIRLAMFAEGGETCMQRNWGTDYKADVDGYFRLLPKIIDEMRKTGFYDRQMIVDAWITMMLRAMLWGASHFFVPGERVPIQYYGSQLPVFIG
jgi:hypothetical protein